MLRRCEIGYRKLGFVVCVENRSWIEFLGRVVVVVVVTAMALSMNASLTTACVAPAVRVGAASGLRQAPSSVRFANGASEFLGILGVDVVDLILGGWGHCGL